MTQEKILNELTSIRMRLTKIYMDLGNPKNITADSALADDIKNIENEELIF